MNRTYLLLVGTAIVGLLLFLVARTIVKHLDPPTDDGVVSKVRDADQEMTSWAVDWRDKLLGDPAAAKLDLNHPGEEEFEFLESRLRSDDPETRRAAAKALLEIEKVRAFRPLIAAIGEDADDGQFLLDTAFEILEPNPLEVRVNILLYTYDQEAPSLPGYALTALRLRMKEEGLMEPDFLHEAMISASNPAWRRFAVQELASVEPPQRGAIAAAMADPDESVRDTARRTFKALTQE